MAFSGTPFFRETRFTQFFIRENGLDKEGFEEWIFSPGMLFNAMDKWWGDRGKRDKPHEGLDLCFYKDTGSEVHQLNEETRIPAWYDGIVVCMVDDFIGTSVIVEHQFPDSTPRKWCTIYGHTVPSRSLHAGTYVREGDIIATLTRRNPSAKGIPPHLHLSLGAISKDPSYGQLDWKTIGAQDGLTLVDPLPVMQWPYLMTESESPPYPRKKG